MSATDSASYCDLFDGSDRLGQKKTSIYDFELDKNIQIILTETVAGP